MYSFSFSTNNPDVIAEAARMLYRVAKKMGCDSGDLSKEFVLRTPEDADTAPIPPENSEEVPTPEPTEEVPEPPLTHESSIPEPEQLDKAGFPWIPEIHNSKKKKLSKTDNWMLKRGVSKELVDRIIAEYRGKGYGTPAPTPPETTTPPPPPPTPDAGSDAPKAPPPHKGDSPAIPFAELNTALAQAGQPYTLRDEVAKSLGLENYAKLISHKELVEPFVIAFSGYVENPENIPLFKQVMGL